MAITVYTISLFTHILFVITWLATIPVHMVVDRAIGKLQETKKQFEMMKISTMNVKISLISAVVIFLSGAFMVEAGGLGWAPSEGSIWLVVKQTIWLFLLVAIFLLIKPLADKLTLLIDDEADAETVEETYKNLKIRGHILTTFIIINIFLAATKPF